jgi:hypothetical protein
MTPREEQEEEEDQDSGPPSDDEYDEETFTRSELWTQLHVMMIRVASPREITHTV